MFRVEGTQPWSETGIRVLIGSTVASVALALIDGLLRGALLNSTEHRTALTVFATWALDFRYLADQAIYASVIFIVGAKFIETRTVFSIGFDRLDRSKIALKGPDEENTVWVGRRYGTLEEAEAVAAVFAERLQESAV